MTVGVGFALNRAKLLPTETTRGGAQVVLVVIVLRDITERVVGDKEEDKRIETKRVSHGRYEPYEAPRFILEATRGVPGNAVVFQAVHRQWYAKFPQVLIFLCTRVRPKSSHRPIEQLQFRLRAWTRFPPLPRFVSEMPRKLRSAVLGPHFVQHCWPTTLL